MKGGRQVAQSAWTHERRLASAQNHLLTRKIQPVLRWAGGKQGIVNRILNLLPGDILNRTYHEPFLGGASVFLRLQPQRAYLSDANERLIACYKSIRENPKLFHTYLLRHGAESSGSYYYRVRTNYNKCKSDSVAQAARFLYLNRTCFNGIFRVNRSGRFNVPYGRKEPPPLPSLEHLYSVSELLSDKTLRCLSFEDALSDVRRGDFVYLDPPYPPLNGTSFFTHYTADRFDVTRQVGVAHIVRELDRLGALVLVSNADTRQIRRLYSSFAQVSIPVTRFITCKKRKHAVRELLIRNYDS